MAALPETAEKRRHDRQDTGIPGSVVVDGDEYACKVLNLSSGGARIACPSTIPVGRAVTLWIRHLGSFSGLVAWIGKEETGIKFDQDSAMITHFLGGWSSFEREPPT